MDIQEELNLLKKTFIVHQTIFNDIHNRLKILETPLNKDSEHYFYHRDLDNGCWLVRCAKTGGTFSTALWRNEKEQKQKCPCCGDTVRRKT